MNMLNSKIMRKNKSPFIIYARRQWKAKSRESYMKIYKKRSYGYKLLCVDDKFSKPFEAYLGNDVVCAVNFIKNIVKENKYCSHVMKKHFIKELVVTKKTMKIL